MRNILWLSLIFISAFAHSQEDVTFSLANPQYTNGGSTYEVDIMISSTMGFKLGSGQLYLNYNNLAFGNNAYAAGNIVFTEPDGSILGTTVDGGVSGPLSIYTRPDINDNTLSRVSYAWQQDLGGDVISGDNVTPVAALLAHVAFDFMPGNEGVDPMICFESLAPFDDQTFTACGSEDGRPGTIDCDNYPNEQITNDAFDCSALLPLNLLTFQARPKATTIALDWSSADEVNFSGYELQRATDGRNFQQLAWVPGKGDAANTYTYEDTKVKAGQTYYYRLWMKDVDGTTSYSDIRKALLPQDGDEVTIQVQPNPAQHAFYINFELDHAAATTVELYSAEGRQVYQAHYQLPQGSNQLLINVTPYPAGLYTAVVRADNREWKHRVVVEK